MTKKCKRTQDSKDRGWEKEDKRLTRYASYKSDKSLGHFLSQQASLSAIQTTTGLKDWQTQDDNIIDPATDVPSLANLSTSSTLGYYSNISSPPDLYVKNLDDAMDDNKLRELFAGFGTIQSCKVMRARDGNRGFVTFSTPQISYRAFIEMNFKPIGRKPLHVTLEPDIEDRRFMLQTKLSQMRTVPSDPSVAPCMPMYHGLGQLHGMPNSFVPMARQGQQIQRPGGRHGGAGRMQHPQQQMPLMPQQTLPRGGYAISQPIPNGSLITSLVNVSPNQQITQGRTPNSFVPMAQQGQQIQRPGGRHGGVGRMQQPQQLMPLMPQQTLLRGDHAVSQPIPNGGLVNALVNASPDQQRTMLGEILYPLVDKQLHEMEPKVLGMLLEMDQTAVGTFWNLLSPEVAATEVLRNIQQQQQQQQASSPTDRLASHSLNEALSS